MGKRAGFGVKLGVLTCERCTSANSGFQPLVQGTEPMFHVFRNASGVIQSVSRETQPGSELLDEDDPEIQRFFKASGEPSFDDVDAGFVRVLEDLIDTLILKNVIHHTDLPSAAQRKLMLRKGLRTRIHGALNLLGNDDRLI
jgi:hypothetical protein